MNKLDKAFSDFCKKQGVKHPGQFADDVRPTFDAGYAAGQAEPLGLTLRYPIKGQWQAHETRVYLPNLLGGFDLYGCPNAEATAARIAECVNAVGDRTVQAFQARDERLDAATALMQEFCDRVDKGEVRSTRTYAKFRQFLEG